MNIYRLIFAISSFLIIFISSLNATVYSISSQSEFDSAHENAMPNDSLIWEDGTYSNIFMDITRDDLYILSEHLGKTIFTGSSRVEIDGDNIVFQGFQFIDGEIGTRDVINIRGSHILVDQINIRAYTCYKYLRIRESSQYVTVRYSNFENRLNLDDQNILSILVNIQHPGYHKIQHCSFKNFDGTGNDLGIEPIRIGLSTQANRISRSVVEYCYFTQCNGDGELISSKARQNVYRYNTFEDNPKAELVLRHGSENIVYGNFFLNGKGGVRVREGQEHYIYNNYFYALNDRPIYLQNEDSDPLDNINIAFNTIIGCDELILGGDGSDKPTNVTLSNNIFADPDDDLFEDPTGNETWISNITSGSLGISLPASGITVINPQLDQNSDGYFGLSANSPAINAAEAGYALLPTFEGIENIDAEINFDLMGQSRPDEIENKDIGCSEYPHEIIIRPIATEENTGPEYNTSILNSVENNIISINDLISISPNPVSSQVQITITSKRLADIKLMIIDSEGKQISKLSEELNFSGTRTKTYTLNNLVSGVYTLQAISQSNKLSENHMQNIRFIKL